MQMDAAVFTQHASNTQQLSLPRRKVQQLPMNHTPSPVTILCSFAALCIRIASAAAAVAVLTAETVHAPDCDLLLAAVSAALCTYSGGINAAMLRVSAVQHFALDCVLLLARNTGAEMAAGGQRQLNNSCKLLVCNS
jgi:hypothetical protein